MERIQHPIAPVWDSRSRILILGSFPSVRSRQTQFFYGHAQNRFWPLLSSLLGCGLPRTTEEKRAMLLAHGVALWDVVSSCEIEGSSDSSIRGVRPNDLRPILEGAEIRQIFCNGKTAFALYRRLLEPALGRGAVCLPSTSPANAARRMPELLEAWRAIVPFLED